MAKRLRALEVPRIGAVLGPALISRFELGLRTSCYVIGGAFVVCATGLTAFAFDAGYATDLSSALTLIGRHPKLSILYLALWVMGVILLKAPDYVDERHRRAKEEAEAAREQWETDIYNQHAFGDERDKKFNRICLRCGKPSGPIVRDGLPCVPNCQSTGNDLMEKDFRAQLEVMRASYPELPTVPYSSLEYGGWFTEAISRIRVRSKSHTLQEQQSMLAVVRGLHEEYKRICELRFSISRMKGEEELKRTQTEKDIIELEAQIERAIRARDAARNGSETDKLQDDLEKARLEADRTEHELRRIRAEMEIQKIKNSPTGPPVGPKPSEDEVQKLLRELLRKAKLGRPTPEEIKEQFMQSAKIIAQELGEPDRLERLAQKIYEDAYPRRPL